MIGFWILTALLASLAGWTMLTLAGRGARSSEAALPRASAAELDELDRLKARGLLDDAAWTAARAEAGRRMLGETRETRTPVSGFRDAAVAAGAAAVTVLAALGLYWTFGAPGLPDQPYAKRVDEWSQSVETLAPPQIAAVVAREVERRPDDPRALSMLGVARFEADDPIGAASAFRRALTVQPDDARNWARLGESLVRANGGEVDGDAEAAFRRALELDANQLGARYFLGEAALSRGETARVRQLWGPLIAALDPADPRRADLERRLPR